MSSPEQEMAELGLVGLEGLLAVADETAAIEERLRKYGALDRAHDRTTEYAEALSIPPVGACRGRVYRDVDLYSGKETGGGVQLDFCTIDDTGLSQCAVRVPAYRLVDGRVRPAGGVFDDPDNAEMVAAQVENLLTVAAENHVQLSEDLTYIDESDIAGLVVITCPAYDN